MTERVIHLRDYQPKAKERRAPEVPATVVVLPMIRTGRYDHLPSDCEPADK